MQLCVIHLLYPEFTTPTQNKIHVLNFLQLNSKIFSKGVLLILLRVPLNEWRMIALATSPQQSFSCTPFDW
jgi:hypothetical protein